MFRLCKPAALALLLLAVPLQAADVDPFIPAETEQVIFINVRQMLDSPLVKKHGLEILKDAMAKDPNVKQMLTTLGLDPLKDIDSVLITNKGTEGDKVLVVVRGKFDLSKIEPTIEAVAKNKPGEVKISKDGKLKIYETAQQGKPLFSTFLDGNTIVATTTKGLLVDAAAKKPAKLHKDLAAALTAVNSKQSMYMVAVVPDEVKKMLANQEAAANLAPKLRVLTASVAVTKDVAINVKIETDDEKSAEELGDLAKQGKALIQFAAANNDMLKEAKPLIDGVLKSIDIKTTKNSTSVSMKLSAELIEKAMEKLPKQ